MNLQHDPKIVTYKGTVQVCSVCDTPLTVANRCTNGRCLACHDKHCSIQGHYPLDPKRKRPREISRA